jgi:cytoskeletal protein CcmA (bactofilin family)
MLVVAIGAVVTFIVFTWVAFSLHRSHKSVEKRDSLHARYAAESVVSAALYEQMLNPTGLPSPDSAVQIVRAGDSLSNSPAESTVVYRDSIHGSEAAATLCDEGPFIRVMAKGTAGKETWEIDAQFGQELSSEYRYALILSIQNKPLEVKRGRIVGDVKVAQQPTGSIDGNIEAGTIVTLPQVDESKLQAGMRNLEEKTVVSDSGETVLQGSHAFDEHSWPRSLNTAGLSVSGHLLIQGRGNRPLMINGPLTVVAGGDIQLSGNVEMSDVSLVTAGQIKCFDKVRLSAVTVYAKKMIYFDNQVRCSGDFYSLENLTLAGQSEIEMPSFAYVKGSISKDPKKTVYGLQLMQESRFSGTFFCASGASFSTIERDARFTGLLYTRGRLALQGTVFGCIAAASLAESVEDDRCVLAGGSINRKVLPKNFMIPRAFGTRGAGFRLVSWSENRPSEIKNRDNDE